MARVGRRHRVMASRRSSRCLRTAGGAPLAWQGGSSTDRLAPRRCLGSLLGAAGGSASARRSASSPQMHPRVIRCPTPGRAARRQAWSGSKDPPATPRPPEGGGQYLVGRRRPRHPGAVRRRLPAPSDAQRAKRGPATLACGTDAHGGLRGGTERAMSHVRHRARIGQRGPYSTLYMPPPPCTSRGAPPLPSAIWLGIASS